MATLKLTIDGSRAYADGRSLVIYRLTHKQQTTRIGFGVKVLKQDWDPLKCRINKSHPESKELNLILSKKVLDLEKKLLLITSCSSNLNISDLKDAFLLTEENKRFLFMCSYFF